MSWVDFRKSGWFVAIYLLLLTRSCTENVYLWHNYDNIDSQMDIHGAYAAAFLGAAFFFVALGFLGAAAFFGLVALGFVAVLKVGGGMSERRYEQS
jgi:hypothetical protein